MYEISITSTGILEYRLSLFRSSFESANILPISDGEDGKEYTRGIRPSKRHFMYPSVGFLCRENWTRPRVDLEIRDSNGASRLGKCPG